MTASVLYIHQDGLITGSAISLRNLLLGLDRQRFSPRVLLAQEGPARKLFEALDIQVDMIPIRGMWTAPGPRFPTPDYFRNLLALFHNSKLYDYLRDQHPDLVHINDKALLPAGIAAHRLGIPVIWHLRSTYAVSSSRLQAAISRQVIRRKADYLIPISEDEEDGFEDLPNRKIIHNSVDFEEIDRALKQRNRIRLEMDINPQELLIGTVGTTLNEIRGTWDFIRAAGLLQARLPDARMRFIVVGNIPTPEVKAQAQLLARQAGIEDRILLTGFRPDALHLMAGMDIVVVCSRHGVLGRMPLEAMGLGQPLVVTAGHSGRSRVVMDGQTALVVPAANPEAIANSIARLIGSSTLRGQLGQQGRMYAREHFDPQKNAQRVMKVYDQLLAAHADIA
jgi:glycosyltransferase involved in cell wall biosynthesis